MDMTGRVLSERERERSQNAEKDYEQFFGVRCHRGELRVVQLHVGQESTTDSAYTVRTLINVCQMARRHALRTVHVCVFLGLSID